MEWCLWIPLLLYHDSAFELNRSRANTPRAVGYLSLHRESSIAAECRALCPSSSPSLLHVRPLTLHFPCSNHQRPPSLPTQLLALPWPEKCCAFLLPQLWWNRKRRTRSFQGPTNIFTGQAERVAAFPDHFKWSCSKVPTHYAMPLPANAAGVLASARFREASSHLHVYTLLLSLQKCGIYRYRPSGRTQARWDIGQSQLSFLFDLIWNLLVKERSQKFYSHIKLCEFAGFLEPNIWGERSREGKSKINYNEVWNAVRYFIHKGEGCAKLPFWARSFPDAALAGLTWRESWDLYYFLIKLGRRI